MAQTTVAINLEAKTKGTESVKSLKTQIREATAEAVALSRKFGEFSPEATAAAQKVAKLKDEMGDFQQRVAGLNPDKFAAIGTVVKGLAGGIQAAQGAMALFGNESEDVQKAMLKVQGAMAFAQGVDQLMEMENSFGAMAGVIKTQLVTAFTTLRGAIAATGIGILVIGIATLVSNVGSLTGALNKMVPGFKEGVKVIKDAINAVTDFIGVTSEAERQLEQMTESTLRNNKAIDNQIKILEAQGGKEEEIYKLRKKQANDELQTLRDKAKLGQELTQEEIDRARELVTELKVLDAKRSADIQKATDDARKKADEEAKKRNEDAVKNAEERKQNQLEINATMLALDQSTLDAQIKAADAAFATKVAQYKKDGYTAKQIATLRDEELEKIRTAFYDKQKADTDKANKEREDQLKEAREKEIAATQKATEDYFIAKQTEYIQRNATQAEFDALELERLNKQLADAKKYGEDTVTLEKDIAAKKKDIYDKDKKAKEDVEKAKRDAELATLQSASQILGSLGQLFGENEKSQKAFGLAQIAVDTATALTQAQANAMSATPDNVATGGIAGFAKYAAYVGIILSNVARAKALLKGGGGGTSGGGTAGTPAAPSFAPITGGSLPDEQQFGGMGRVYVLEGDITKTQTRVRRLRNTSVV